MSLLKMLGEMPGWVWGVYIVVPLVLIGGPIAWMIYSHNKNRKQKMQADAAFAALPRIDKNYKILGKSVETKHTGETQTHYSRAYQVYKFTLEGEDGQRQAIEVNENIYSLYVEGDDITVTWQGDTAMNVKKKV